MKILFYKLKINHRYFGINKFYKSFEIGFYYYNLFIDYRFQFWSKK